MFSVFVVSIWKLTKLGVRVQKVKHRIIVFTHKKTITRNFIRFIF